MVVDLMALISHLLHITDCGALLPLVHKGLNKRPKPGRLYANVNSIHGQGVIRVTCPFSLIDCS